MKKFLVIGNPIEHSLSPELHNYWIKQNMIDAIYEKKKLKESEIENIITDIKSKKIEGINVTVPFKNMIIPFLDKLTEEAKETQSVNTIYLNEDKIIGHNTDIEGFYKSVKYTNYDLTNKKVLILGSGGVVSSIIFALKKMKVSKIILSNRTKNKAEKLKNFYNDIEIIDWGEVCDFDMIINATSVGLNKNDKINLNFSKIKDKKFFYDVIYNPKETDFLTKAKNLGNIAQNGKMMFIFQAAAAFKVWNGFDPEINENVIKLLNK